MIKLYNKENEFKDGEIKGENLIKPNDEQKDEASLSFNNEQKPDRPEENTIDYSAVSGTKEYIYTPRAGESSAMNEANSYNQDDNQAQAAESKPEETIKRDNQNYSSAYNEKAYSSVHDTNNYTSAYNESVDESVKAKKPKRRFVATVALILVVSMLSGAAGSLMTIHLYKNGTMQQNTDNINNAQSVKIDLNDGAYYAAAVNEKTKNTVVGVTTTLTMVYESFWGSQERDGQSIGSGIIVDPNGLILTNSHVIGDGHAKKIVVSLTDGTTEEASVLWYDQALDLAVIKINRTGLSAAELGDSDTLIVGEPVVAIGNPMSLSLNGTLTNGVVSGLNRSITINGTTIKPLIQTNASINPGNSGGPLFNAEGKVIGINTAKMSSAEGLGFSIPINVVIPILNQITKGETVNSLYIGIQGMSVSEYKERMGIALTVESGVFVAEIVKDSPADKAGLMYGDIIIAIDKTEIKEMTDLKRTLYNYKEGDKVQVKYLRNGSESTSEITLAQKPKNY